MPSFPDLVTEYGSAPQIPDQVLYDFVTSSWDVLSRGIPEEVQTSGVGKEVRRRAKSDLWFLGNYFLWSSSPWGVGQPFTQNIYQERVHRRIADLFVKKDDTKNIAQQDDRCKERVLLAPRVIGKTSWDIADSIQWILNFPYIRILFLTAEDGLAEDCLSETKGHFIRKDEKSWMQVFFDEYCIEDVKTELENKQTFTCPLWKAQQTRRREPTILASSIVSTLSGKHYEIMKCDDVVSDKNSDTEEQCAKIARKVDLAKKLLMPYGYIDFMGTRYQDEDLYGGLIEKNVGEIKKESGPCWELTENLTTGRKILINRAWQLKPAAQERLNLGTDPITGVPVRAEDFKEPDYDLLFPEVLPYGLLSQERIQNEVIFEGQRNQNPRPAIKTAFDLPLLMKRTLGFGLIPFSGPRSQVWDFAFSDKKNRDYTTGVTVLWSDKGEMYVIDIVRARFKPADLARAIVDFAMKWKPFVVGVEDAAGSKNLDPAIVMEAIKTGSPEVQAVCGKIDWFPVDQRADAKRSRIKTLHPLLVNNMLAFAAYVPFLDVLYHEFERCLHNRSHDDIPDVIAMSTRYAPRMVAMMAKNDIQTVSPAGVEYNLMFEEGADAFGRINYSPVQPVVTVSDPEVTVETPSPEFSGILGAGLCG